MMNKPCVLVNLWEALESAPTTSEKVMHSVQDIIHTGRYILVRVGTTSEMDLWLASVGAKEGDLVCLVWRIPTEIP